MGSYRIYTIFISHLKTWWRSRTTIFWTLAFPILLMVLFGGIFSLQENKLDLYVQNQDVDSSGTPSPLSLTFVKALESTNAFNLRIVDPDEDIAKEIDERRIPRILIIPLGFEEEVSTGDGTLLFKLDRSQASALTVLGIVDAVVAEVNSKVSNAPKLISLTQENIVSSELRFIDFFMPGVVALSIMSTGMFGAIGTNTKYRQNKVLRKLATTPLSKLEWILGMILFQMIIALISAGLIVAIGITIFNIQVRPDFFALAIIISGALVFPGIGMVVARFVKDEEAADAAGNAITFPMMFLSGTFFPLEIMPDILQNIARVLPLTYMNEGLRDAMIFGRPEGALLNMTVILVLGAAFIILGSLVTSWRED